MSKKFIRFVSRVSIFLFAFFFLRVNAQTTVSISFTYGFLGTQTTNTQQTTDNKLFSTLGILRASFSQVSSTGQFGGTQGNDLSGTIKLYLSNGTVISKPGALNWRITKTGRIEYFGFILDPGQSASIPYGSSQTYTITGGSTANTSTSLAFRAYGKTLTYTDGSSQNDGNAATAGLLDALNQELLNSPQPSVISLSPASVIEGNNLVYNVTLSSQTTNTQVFTFSKSGSSSDIVDYNTTFTFSNGVVDNGDGTITVPVGVSSFSITVVTLDDPTVEPTETLILTIGSKSATGNILDNDGGFGGGAISADQTICINTAPSAFVSDASASGGTAPITYSWESSVDGVNFTTVAGSTNTSTFTAGTLTQTTYFRRKAVDNTSAAVYSNEITVTIQSASVAGTATTTSTAVCTGSTAALSLSGSNGNIQWQSSNDGITWSNLSGETSSSLTSGTLTQTTYFRAQVTNGVCSSVNSGTVTITIDATSVGGSSSAVPSAVCSGSTSLLSLTGYTGTIQWQSSTDNSTWANVSGGTGATTASYTSATLTQTTYFRALVTNGVCSAVASNAASVTVTENPAAPASISGPTKMVAGTTKTFTAAAVTGATSYTWTLSTGWTGTSTSTTISVTAGTTAGTITVVANSGTCTSPATAITVTIAPDHDGDGLSDEDDFDDDNDGILDTVENAVCDPASASCDTDGDGIANKFDLDSDGDGITDVIESDGTDANKDGRADGAVDANGVPATANGGSTPPDTDKDGKSDPYDVDSDADGIPDNREGQGTYIKPAGKDTDGDGLDDAYDPTNDGTYISPVDTDKDGKPDYRDVDSDGDGIPDEIEKGKDGSNPVDTDGDGTPDYRDLDADNDGIPDATEKGTDGANPKDTDKDGIPDYLDIDSDNDGITDKSENGAGPDLLDTDKDGIPDILDLDSDGDGITDVVEADGTDADKDGRADGKVDANGVPESAKGGLTAPDTDGDGKRDFQDVDSDADGIPDNREGQGTYVKPAGKDTDGDGLDDAYDPTNDGTYISPVDTDKDGKPDYRDVDSDGDGIPDEIEKGKDGSNPVDTDGDGTPDYRDLDSDNDGIPDTIEKGKDGTKPVDTDGDGIPDYQELDSDNDGIPDATEKGADGNAPRDSDKDGIPDYLDIDSDNDGITDKVENNGGATVLDTDKDGIPDILDLDSDGDGISDVVEADGTDADQDGRADGKVDANGVPESAKGGVNPPDTDGDGKRDFQELDSDNDGLPDNLEGQGKYIKPTGKDTDGDGLDDAYDGDNKGTYIAPVDTDKDGRPDFRETDSDNDGIPDKVEAGKDGNSPVDTDGDGTPDYRELDSDNDGIPDVDEAGPNPSSPQDSNGDGIPDYQQVLSKKGSVIPDGETLLIYKEASKPIVQSDGSIKMTFTIKVKNNRNEPLTQVMVKDDLTKTFPSPTNFTVIDYTTAGTIVRNAGFNGKTNIELLTTASTLGAFDSALMIITVRIEPNGFSGAVKNIADGSAQSKWGPVSRQSIDLSLSNGRQSGAGVPTNTTLPEIEVFIADVLTPNNDGLNDRWIILKPFNITVGVKIFNRWGQLIYSNSNYNNDWDGRSSITNEYLPHGSYFYLVELTNRTSGVKTVRKGPIMLKREF